MPTSAERRLIGRLSPALREAAEQGRPVHVEHLHTMRPQREVIRFAAELCVREQAKLAVLPAERGVVFVPV